MLTKYFLIIFLYFITGTQWASGQNKLDGSELWFTHMETIESASFACPSFIWIPQSSPTFTIIHKELKSGLNKLYNREVKDVSRLNSNGLCVGTSSQKDLSSYFKKEELSVLGNDGYIIRTTGNNVTIIIANTDLGALYGTYHYLRYLQTDNTHKANFDIVEVPSYQRRILNHWDNLDGTVERGYAGHSIWQWKDLPQKISPGYIEYARANASIGINGTVLNNVNANPAVLSIEYLKKVKTLADIFRPYGIKVYLSINFSSPSVLGGLTTADPLNKDVRIWWQDKAKQIYSLIPDFGGFVVKANSEGLPGPQDFGRTHADGANMLADVLESYGGIIMWRAFVYNPNGNDRAKQAYNEFKPLDGKFRKNVILQVKNGPVDFQPREPFSPLFGAMQHTTLMPELQITQEYLGFSDHLVYLGTLFKEFLNSDTYTNGRNSTVSRITDGSVYDDSITAVAGVANIGLDSNWCGHHFAQANWYAFGRLAWNHQLSARKIAKEWLMQTFSHDQDFLNQMSGVMMESREATVNYMTPLGLHHLMGWGHHYGPEPWCEISGARPDWLPTYYHKADSIGVGFNRSSSGSNAVSQYAEPLLSVYNDPALCPEELLLWFHHLPWNYELINGRDLWSELCYRYSMGVEQVKYFQCTWNSLQSKVDKNRFNDVQNKLAIQLKEAIWWRDACLLYFQTFSHRPIPSQLDQPKSKLEDLKELKFLKTHHN
ncbi:alpha-glucuronidase family glycosyl hydrolase [Labilibaculum manganireducens]|uniref:alpha-glucuronidase family glycosyl hydrolase n=1 Tax=Labilibaculum manganireducens TaxID=1940525 RepID=UPI000C6E36DC|nr:alpha-glucuronidase family glycosyl hydrolase [Labilibaculum manganireducens]